MFCCCCFLLLLFSFPGLDSSGYRTSSAGGQEFTDGTNPGDESIGVTAVDPFEGTVGLFVSCPDCHVKVDVQGSRVRGGLGFRQVAGFQVKAHDNGPGIYYLSTHSF